MYAPAGALFYLLLPIFLCSCFCLDCDDNKIRLCEACTKITHSAWLADNFKPASIDDARPASLKLSDGHKVGGKSRAVVTHETNINKSKDFEGHMTTVKLSPYNPPRDAVLIFLPNGGEDGQGAFRLDHVISNVNLTSSEKGGSSVPQKRSLPDVANSGNKRSKRKQSASGSTDDNTSAGNEGSGQTPDSRPVSAHPATDNGDSGSTDDNTSAGNEGSGQTPDSRPVSAHPATDNGDDVDGASNEGSHPKSKNERDDDDDDDDDIRGALMGAVSDTSSSSSETD